jgi:drug/metabolite transporter (DMT)-like permease
MLYLFLVSLLWAFSFGLIKDGLAGLPAAPVAFLRLLIAAAVFAPFLRLRTLRPSGAARLLLTGAVQYGLMYVAYIHAFHYLQAYEVALFTVFTPIYVSLINDLFEKRFSPRTLFSVLLAAAGGVVIKYRALGSEDLWIGFALMQAANLCFAFGQIFYRRTMAHLPDHPADRQVFGLLCLGATLAAGAATAGFDWSSFRITPQQFGILLYLGAVASGVGFFLWNCGARRTGAGTLAVFNNLKIPLGILVSVLLFREKAEWSRLFAGGMLMVAALLLNRRQAP